ncbi:MAG: 6-phosphogluconolactonase [Clostridiaceae bacterium]|nr:6-phosphogluconolactonase [Eubacteriales bacterium]
MKIHVFDTVPDFNRAVAWRIIGQILQKPDSVIGLAAGSTTEGIHAAVADIWLAHPFDLSRVTFYGLDEIIGAPAGFDFSCLGSIRRHLRADELKLGEERFIFPPVRSDDYERECVDFVRRIAAAGGSDLQILGIGPDGHLAMNLPGIPPDSTTRLVELSPQLQADIRQKGDWPAEAPMLGITLGLRDIINMPCLLLAAKGGAKAKIIHSALVGPVTSDVPASILQLHPFVEVYLDAEAAALLR